MSSLICAHAATNSDSSSICMIIPFPVLMSNIHFRFFLILLVTFEVISHKWSWYNSTKVYHPKLHQLGKQFNKFVTFGLGTISLALAIYPNFWGLEICLRVIFRLVWHWWVWSSAPDLRDVNNSCTLVFPCFHLLWFGLHLLFLALSPILALGLAMMGFAFLSSFLDKSTYTIVHRCNFLPLMLRNCIILPKSSCFKCGLWGKGGNAPTPSSLLVPKSVRK
jgi:hypothetical protein